ncbi:MAG: amidohydrolase [Anaerolineae bacterium]|jgi:amidohydrolase|nr:amidohydrolase [Anaerolineae bacterium]MBT4310419.1 amidohydrolase [Anaerolineae bacterium]MBT4842843.1 amidohydrolase [Anaerolineae bacterium]MBT6061079.1 amidohydrolase [Anaerolineae bacterium]MBT6321256.1 amidohydrolase [Anaerolineae bacterium]
MPNFLNKAEDLLVYTQTLRRDFHMHPELGFEEIRTAGIVAKELRALDLEVTTGIAETGVVALLEGAKPGPVLLLRFDMDALPITEETGAEYASTTQGKMHACGHDGHVAIGLTVAKMLNEVRDDLGGSIKFVFQPAEEGVVGQKGRGGAEQMMHEGVLENPKVDYTLSLHLWNSKPLGWLGVGAGPVMAGAEYFKITVYGKGGHGAMPHVSVDPILAASQIVNALQSVVARNVHPLKPAVLTVASMQGGEAFNVIPSKVEMTGTIRTFETETREIVIQRFYEIIENTAKAMGCTAEVELKQVSPAVINNRKITESVRKAAQELYPKTEIDTGLYTTMAAEDMAYMMEKVPGCYFFLGSANDEQGLNFDHHHPKFDFDEAVLPRAAALMAASAVEILKFK